MFRDVRWLATSLVASGLAGSTVWQVPLHAQDAAAKPAQPAVKVADEPATVKADFTVPEGAPEDLLEFIEEIQNRQPEFTSREEALAYITKSQQAVIQAAEKILQTKDADEDVASEAFEHLLQGHDLLMRIGLPGASKAAMASLDRLSKHPIKDVAAVATEQRPFFEIRGAYELPVEQQKALGDRFLKEIADTKYSRPSLQKAFTLAEVLEEQDDTKLAASYYQQLSEVLKKSDRAEFREQAEKLVGVARRLNLPGNKLEVKGTQLDGKPFNWEAYRGKVVLVDFWATWCGPCIAELPNVKRHYEEYHDKGFDVVAISLDDSKATLESFLAKQKTPWVQLFETDKDKQGWNHPLVSYYGIMGIPTAILVDKEGKVVSMSARGEELATELEKLLGPAGK